MTEQLATNEPAPRPGTFTPPPAAERRARRAEVERSMLRCEPVMKAAQRIAEKYGVLPRAVHHDMHLIRKRWAREDELRGGDRRLRLLKRMERAAVKVYKRDPATGSLIDYRIGRLSGMGGATKTVSNDNRRVVLVGADAVQALLAAQRTPEGRAALSASVEEVVGG